MSSEWPLAVASNSVASERAHIAVASLWRHTWHRTRAVTARRQANRSIRRLRRCGTVGDLPTGGLVHLPSFVFHVAFPVSPCVTLRHPVSALNAIVLITLVNPVNGEDSPDRTVTMPYAMWYVWCSMYCGMGYELPLWVQTDCQCVIAVASF